MRTKEGRLLKRVRQGILDHVTGNGATEPTFVQLSLAERAAQIELRLALFDQKRMAGEFTRYDNDVYMAEVGGLRRLYKEIGIGRATPSFAKLLRKKAAA